MNAKKQGYQPKPGPKPKPPTTGSGVVVPMRRARKGTAVAVHKPQAPRSTLELIAQAARDPTIDVQKLNALLNLQERVEARDNESAFNVALKNAQEQMPRVLKDRGNPITKSKYATLEKVNDTILPIARNHGFSLSFGTEQSHLPDHYRINCVVSHTAGHSRTYKADVPSDGTGMKGTQNKSATQAFGSTMSYGRRYLTLLIFNIVPTENEDNDGNTQSDSGPITKEQFHTLNAKIEFAGADKQKFCAHFGISGIEQLPQKQLDTAMKLLDQKAKKAAS